MRGRLRRFSGAIALVFFAPAIFTILPGPGAPGMAPLVWAKGKSPILTDAMPPVSEEDKAFTRVPYAEGSPAVVLLEVRQSEWTELGDAFGRRLHQFRRVKILTDAGVEGNGDFLFDFYGDWRIQKMQARTTLPDGTEIDATDSIHNEKSDNGYQAVRVAFPKVQKGAILDFNLVLLTDNWAFPEPWDIQGHLPVIESRFTMIPPPGLKYRTALVRLPADQNKPERITMGGGKLGFVWTFNNVTAIPNEANLPPISDITQRLFVIPQEYKDELTYTGLASDWKTYGGFAKKYWDDWCRKDHSKSDALAKEVVGSAGTAAQKAEAIRLALRDRVKVDWIDNYPRNSSPDETLSKGSGNTADVAGLAVAMLKAVGVEARLAVVRRRGNGHIPPDVPVPALFDDALVILPTEGGPQFFSPAADVPLPHIPYYARGILALPLDGKAEAPVPVPDFTAAENRVMRTTNVTLAVDGSVRGEGTETYSGVSAERWRRRLRDLDETGRKDEVQDRLRRNVAGARVQALGIENLNDGSKDLVLKVTWDADGYATVAGKRLLANPNLYNRESASDWAPAERQNEIDLDEAFEATETTSLKLPEGVKDATLPPPASMNAGPVGLYEESCQSSGGTVTCRRHMRLDRYTFPTQAYPGLKHWFSDIAANDDKPIVITLP